LNGVVFDLLVNVSFKLFNHLNDLIINLEFCFLLGDSYDVFIAFEQFRDVDKPDMIVNHLYFFLQTTDFSLGCNLCECISHDSYEHIHEDNKVCEAT